MLQSTGTAQIQAAGLAYNVRRQAKKRSVFSGSCLEGLDRVARGGWPVLSRAPETCKTCKAIASNFLLQGKASCRSIAGSAKSSPRNGSGWAAQGCLVAGRSGETLLLQCLLFCAFSSFSTTYLRPPASGRSRGRTGIPPREVLHIHSTHLVFRILILTLELSSSSELHSAPHSVSAKSSRRHKPRIGFHPSQHAAVRIAP